MNRLDFCLRNNESADSEPQFDRRIYAVLLSGKFGISEEAGRPEDGPSLRSGMPDLRLLWGVT
jgi:hypothetical protein